MPHMEGIFINGEKAKFHPEDILDTDASQYTEEIGESVTAYLTEHLTNPSNPPIDTSLSIAGAAADAKETGDQISKLKSEINSLNDAAFSSKTNLLNTNAMVEGYLSNGILTESTIYKTTEYIDVSDITSVNLSNYIKSSFAIQSKAIRFGAYYSQKSEASFISQDSTNDTLKTIPSGAKFARFTISNDYLANNPMLVVGDTIPTKYVPFIDKAKWEINPLTGKTAVFFGDSVCYGDNWRQDNVLIPRSNTGWGVLLQERHNMMNYGYGVSGSVYPVIDGSSNNIVSQVLTCLYHLTETSYKPDYFILEGGINDAANDVAKGSITETFTEPAIYSTEYSALEFIFYRLKTLCPDSKIGVILPHHASGYAQQTKLKEYIEIIKECCEKWAVPYCDLYTQCQLNGCIELSSYRSKYFDQWGVHPNKAGYEIMTDVIEKWMMNL